MPYSIIPRNAASKVHTCIKQVMWRGTGDDTRPVSNLRYYDSFERCSICIAIGKQVVVACVVFKSESYITHNPVYEIIHFKYP